MLSFIKQKGCFNMDEKQKLVELGAESLAAIIIEAREKIEELRKATDASKSDIDWGYEEGLNTARNILHHAEFMELLKKARGEK